MTETWRYGGIGILSGIQLNRWGYESGAAKSKSHPDVPESGIAKSELFNG
jgi:hypothetical protein